MWRLRFFIGGDGGNGGRIGGFYNVRKAKSMWCKLGIRGLNIVRSRAGGLLMHLLFKFAAGDGGKIITVFIQYAVLVRWCISGIVRTRIRFLRDIVKIEHRDDCFVMCGLPGSLKGL
jgi:hypothetical protein